MKLTYRIDDQRARDAFKRAPAVMSRHVDGALQLGIGEVAAEARLLAPMSLSNLVNSIITGQTGELEYEARTGTNYARYVEGGSGPAAGQAKYYPNPDNLLAYLTTSARARRFTWARNKDKQKQFHAREDQRYDLWWRARAFAWWIYNHGTKAQPYMRPALQAKADSCVAHVRRSVEAGLREIFPAV